MALPKALNKLKPAQKNASNKSQPPDDVEEKRASRGELDDEPIRLFRPRLLAMGLIVSLGGLIFGFDTGQISGFIAMSNFIQRFANNPDNEEAPFSNSREGTIVGLLSIGTLIGAIACGQIADWLGRKLSIVVWNVVFCVGVIVQITAETAWYQVAIGRLVAGFGVGALSVLTPMYQSETAPRQIRGALVSCYQLFITLGIFLAYCINFGTEHMQSAASWRIPMGVGFIFPVLMAVGIMTLRESPRWDYRHGRVERATKTVALSYGVSENHKEVVREMREIREKLEAETADGAKHPWYEIFTGPRMAYRTLLGIVLQSLQQLTGANFFFYYGTTIFQSVGLSNSFVTQMILGGVNFGTTFFGLYVVENFGRRNSLIYGALAMFMCFLVFASVGHFLLEQGVEVTTAGYVMIVFACLFIFAYAATWGPIVWALVAEIYPSKYRAKSIGFATSANWLWNFLISFFTPYITTAIDYRYGYVFAACCFGGAFVVYFFVCESQGRTLEEIDTMYIMHVTPWKSRNWHPPESQDVGQTGIKKMESEDKAGEVRRERVTNGVR